MGTFGTLRCLWILAFIQTDSHYQYWASKVFTKPWSHAAPPAPEFGFRSQYLGHARAGSGHSGRPWAPLTTHASTHAIGRYMLPNSHGRGQSFVLFTMNMWVAIWDVYALWFWVYTGAYNAPPLTSRFGLLTASLAFPSHWCPLTFSLSLSTFPMATLILRFGISMSITTFLQSLGSSRSISLD